MFVCVELSSDASQNSGASGHETHEGSDRSGAAGRHRGLWSVSQDEQQSRYKLLRTNHQYQCQTL